MALNKKKGSFTADMLSGEVRVPGKTAGGGSNSVRVILLDGTALSVVLVDKKTLGQVAFDQVVRKLDLLERDYFGLLYEDDHKTMQWLDLLKPIKKQLKKQPYTMFFRVRFYAVDPLALHRNSKEQFYLQLKDDISAGRLPFPSESAHSILSYVLQADVGDYQSSDEDLQYLQEKRLLALGKDMTAESSIIKLHKLLQGKPADVAVEKFLRKTRELDSYGAKFNVVQFEGIPYRMSMSPAGITLYQDSSRKAHFKWRKVLQVSYKHKRFTLKIKSKSSESGEKTIVYEVESGKLCKDMWEQCVERISFYNDHQARYKETALEDAGSGKSRSPSPPITREYATINDATPQLEGARQQSLQSSPSHSSSQDNPNPQLHSDQQQGQREAGRGGREGRGRHTKEETGDDHVDGNSPEDERTREPLVTGAHGRVVRRNKEEKKHHSTHQQAQSPQGPGLREDSEERDFSERRDEDRRSRLHSSKVLSLPRRLPTGDPMLHHMMQFQNLEHRSSHGTLLSDSDSAIETTSPIVSTCDENSTCMSPELTGMGHRHGSRELEPVPEARHARSQSLPQPQTEQWGLAIQPPHAAQAEETRGISLAGGRVKNDASGKRGTQKERNGQEDHSISEDRSEDSIHSSLQELADLLGEDDVPRVKEGREQRSSVESTPATERKRENGSPLQSQKKEAGVEEVTETSPQIAREERERKRRQKQLQKHILLQRQQLKEQKLKEYIEQQKKERAENAKATEKVSVTRERPSRKHHGDHQNSPRGHAGDIQTRGRGQYSLKARPHQSQGPSHSPSRHNSDAGLRKERKTEERDMVRSWAKSQQKAHKESHLVPLATGSSSAPQGSMHAAQKHKQFTPTVEPIYNTLAPKETSEGDSDAAAEGVVGRSFEILPSSPPPPPYKSPSPPHKTAMGFGQMPHNEVDGSTGWQRESETHNTVTSRTRSLNHKHSFSSQTISTPPTLHSGEHLGGSHSTLSNNSPQLPGNVNRSPRFTHSFSGGSHSTSDSATGSSPHTPTRAHSVKSGQYSPAKQQSPSLVSRRVEEYGREGSGASAKKGQPVRQYKGPEQPTQGSGDELDAVPINIDPSVLQKEDLTIAPHNYLKTHSPPYDTLDEDEKEIPLVPLSKRPPTQSGTQYKLETALQEVMTSENLPPPPTHLLEISGQLEDIDYHDLDAPPSAVSGAVIPSRTDYEQHQSEQQQKTGINPEMIAKSLDVPRRVSNPTQYPPHIAKFMSRVRNSSIDADDPTLRALAGEQTFPDSTSPATGEVPVSDEQTTQNSESKGNQKSALGRTLSLENARKQTSHPFASIDTRPRSGTAYTVRRQVPATSYSLPRGHYTPSTLKQFAGSDSHEITPPSAHTHTHGDLTAGREGKPIPGAQKSSGYLQNGRGNPYHSRPYGNRGAAGDDSIPSSPTYFTQHHPHKNEPTPSPETQFFNQSFKEHLNSLQPSKGKNVESWMQESSDYWNSNKSVPLFKDPRRTIPAQAPNRSPHFYDQTKVSPPSLPTNAPTVPSMGTKQSVAVIHQPVRALHPPHIRHRELVSASNPAMNVPRGSGILPNLLSSSASNTSLPRNTHAALGSTQSIPNYPRPNSAKVGNNYYVLDV